MLLALSLLVVLQGTTARQRPAPAADTGARAATDTSAPAPSDGAAPERDPEPRIPLTPALLATAYRDPIARDLIARARAARLEQDSSLLAYDATARQRITVRIALRQSSTPRLLFRSEEAARVRWRRGVGAYVDVLGARAAIPVAFRGVRVLRDAFDGELVPYFPGREGLMQLAGMRRVGQREHGVFVHPLDHGAEAYYQYASADSVTFRLPDGSRIRLREVRVIPREPRYDLIVGSLWFDVASAHLVRAAYRPAAPWDLAAIATRDDPHAFDDVPGWVKPMIFPMQARIDAFTVEYGLHQQRWWLPRSESVEGSARVGFAHSPFSVLESYDYAAVNGSDSLPPIRIDSMSDSAHRIAMHARRDSIRAARRMHPHSDGDGDEGSLDCVKGDTLVERRRMYDGAVPVEIRVPCDTVALAHAPELPPSIFAPGEELFGLRERDDLLKSLPLSLEPSWHPLPPAWHYGLDRGMVRYNRVEGLSAGVLVEQELGSGLTGSAMARIGTADLEPNGELRVRLSDGRRTIGAAVYRRLVPAGDWGDPFSFGSSLGALVLGRDEGFYYRSLGAELTRASRRGSALIDVRVFAEREGNASVETNVSLPNALHGSTFLPNIRAQRADALGLGVRLRDAYGLDPRGWRLALDARAEGATGTFDYARGALDATLSHAIAGPVDGALTLSAGTTGGGVPVQRLWYLGGTWTVRGQPPGTMAGDAYWLGRAEVGWGSVAVRPVLFADLGWAGDRSDWAHPGRPMSGAGVGISFLEGLVRLDLARGIHPSRGWRGDLYLESGF